MPSPKFTYDRSIQRYRYTTGNQAGQFVSESKVRKLSEQTVTLVEDDIYTIARLLINNKISTGTWESETANALKILHIQQYTLGKGGLKHITPTDLQELSSDLRMQFGYLRQFSQDITSTGMSEAQFLNRIDLYIQASRNSFEAGRFEAHKRDGWQWEKRKRNAVESCDDCIMWAAMGWQIIGTLPNKGERCECRVRCRCYKVYSKEKPLQDWGWVNREVFNDLSPL